MKLFSLSHHNQPHGFEEGPRDESGKLRLAWRVKKGLYGLKQSPRQWSKKFSVALLRRGFKPLTADSVISDHHSLCRRLEDYWKGNRESWCSEI